MIQRLIALLILGSVGFFVLLPQHLIPRSEEIYRRWPVSIQVKAFDTQGRPLTAHVTKVEKIKEYSSQEHVTRWTKRVWGSRIWGLIANPYSVDIDVQTADGTTSTSKVVWANREWQRVSVVAPPPSDQPIGIAGRVHGCTFNGDWWVIASPMFGADDPWPPRHEQGTIQEDGRFEVSVFTPQRYILAIIHEGEAIKSFALDTRQGATWEDLNLAASCPSAAQ